MPYTPEEYQQFTKKIEEEKFEKQRLRQEKKDAKDKKLRNETQERLVAPILLFISVILSVLVVLFSQN